jgi:transposase
MMGQLETGQAKLFYEFDLEAVVPGDHLLRGIDRFLDLGGLRRHLSPFYSSIGRPSIDPELMIRMLIVGYCFGIRSERRLCEDVHFNLAYRWFCRLGLEDQVPDHSTFSVNRHGRFRESGTLRFVFEQVLERCMAEGLVGGEGFAVDASIVKADANRRRGVPGGDEIHWPDPPRASRPVREYLAALDEAPCGHPVPKNLSLTDPASQWTAAPGGPAFYAYSTNYLIDLDAGIIVDVEATPAHRTDEVASAKTMIDRVEHRFDLKPDRLAGDTAYGAAPMLGWLVDDKKIEPHIPVWDKSKRKDGTFSRADFTFDKEADVYICPGGKTLKTTGRVHDGKTLLYRASKHDCDVCQFKIRCCANTPSRRVPRDVYEAARDLARSLVGTARYEKSRHDRKKVEMLFAHLKRVLKLDRLRLRGLSGAQDEFLLAATAQNLRRMAKWIGRGPPNVAAHAT